MDGHESLIAEDVLGVRHMLEMIGVKADAGAVPEDMIEHKGVRDRSEDLAAS